MSEEKKELTKEAKIEKAKELLQKVKELELNEDELKEVAGGLLFDSGGADIRTFK